MNKNLKPENVHLYKYRFGFELFFNLLIGLGLIGFSIFCYFRFTVDNSLLVIISLLSAVGLVTIGLTANYLTRSLELQVRIDHDKALFEVIGKNDIQSFRLKDIILIEICEQKSIGLYGFAFDFAKYTFHDGKHCIVTNLMTSEYYIPAGIEPKIKKAILPIIWDRTNI